MKGKKTACLRTVGRTPLSPVPTRAVSTLAGVSVAQYLPTVPGYGIGGISWVLSKPSNYTFLGEQKCADLHLFESTCNTLQTCVNSGNATKQAVLEDGALAS